MTQAKAASEQQDNNETEANAPILVDLGKKPKKKVNKLRKGRGPLMDVIDETLAELKSHNKLEDGAQPIVIVVREKKKRSKWMKW